MTKAINPAPWLECVAGMIGGEVYLEVCLGEKNRLTGGFFCVSLYFDKVIILPFKFIILWTN